MPCLQVNILFAVLPPSDDDIHADCTASSFSTKTTSQSGTWCKGGNGVVQWNDGGGLLVFPSVVDDDTTSLRVGLYRNRSLIGFAELKGNAIESVQVQEGCFLCVETRWTVDPPVLVPSGEEKVKEFVVAVAVEGVLESEEEEKGKFWLSYTYLHSDVRTESFPLLGRPEFAAIRDSFKIKSTSTYLVEYLTCAPLLIKLNSFTEGVIAIAVISFQRQSARSFPFLWKRNPHLALGELVAGIDLAREFDEPTPNSSPTKPVAVVSPSRYKPGTAVPNGTAARAHAPSENKSRSSSFEQPPPPPPLPMANQAPVYTPNVSAMEKEWRERLKLSQDQQHKLDILEQKLMNTLDDLEQRDKELSSREQDFKRNVAQKQAEYRMLERRVKESTEHAVSLERMKHEQTVAKLKEAVDDLKREKMRCKRVESEFVGLKDRIADAPFGKQEKEIFKLRGQLEDVTCRLAAERDEKHAAFKIANERIAFLELEIEKLRHGRARAKERIEVIGTVKSELNQIKADKEELANLRRRAMPLAAEVKKSMASTATTVAKSNGALDHRKLEKRPIGTVSSPGKPPPPPSQNPRPTLNGASASTTVALGASSIAELEAARKKMLHRYGEDHPVIQQIDSHIRERLDLDSRR